MFKVGDKVRKRGLEFSAEWYVTAVSNLLSTDPRNFTCSQIVQLGQQDHWAPAIRYELVEPPTKTYRVYQDVTAASADEARAKVGASFQVQEL